MMNLQQVETWVSHLESLSQADMPMEIGGIIMTPRQLLQHARSNDDTWQKVKDKEII
jgi:hypothetical protein